MREPSDHEIAMAICCGEICRSDTKHCHAGDHFTEAYRVRKLLARCGDDTVAPPNPASRPKRQQKRR